MEPVKLGIIGCGIAARELHWPALREMTDKFRITAVCNHTVDKARDFSEVAGGVPYVLDWRELVDRDDVDAVSVMLPFEMNREVAEYALAAGRHIMVEKPLAARTGDAESMLVLENLYPDRVMMVAENFRYRELYLRTRDMLEADAAGSPYAAIWNFHTDLGSPNNARYMGTGWRFEEAYPGGFLVDGGVHIIAAIRMLFGECISVTSLVRSVYPDAGRVDTMSSLFALHGGVICTVNQFYNVPGHRMNTITIYGDKGTIIVDNDASTITLKRRDSSPEVTTLQHDPGYRGEYEDFYAAITTGSEVSSSFDEGYRDLKYMMGAVESAITGERVDFDR